MEKSIERSRLYDKYSNLRTYDNWRTRSHEYCIKYGSRNRVPRVASVTIITLTIAIILMIVGGLLMYNNLSQKGSESIQNWYYFGFFLLILGIIVLFFTIPIVYFFKDPTRKEYDHYVRMDQFDLVDKYIRLRQQGKRDKASDMYNYIRLKYPELLK